MKKVIEETIGLFRENRNRLSKFFREKNDIEKGIIYLESNQTVYRNADTEYPFRQDSNFYWATGCSHLKQSSLVLDFVNDKHILFYNTPSSTDGIWHGKVLTGEEICEKYDLDDSRDISTLKNYLIERLSSDDDNTIYCLPGKNRFIDLSSFNTNDSFLKDALNKLRSVKTDKEIKLMKYASDVSSKAFIEVMKHNHVGKYENYIETLFKYHCGLGGATHEAYPPIVGSGYNSAILHYNNNDAEIKDGDLILLDAGNEFRLYATDITRTFPANRKFTDDQKLIYSIVLDAHKNSINMLKPGLFWDDVVNYCYDYLTERMRDAGFLIGDLDDLKVKRIIRTFMPHGLGHHVGLDVHDTTIKPDVLEQGNVVTIEPGIYFNESSIELARNDTSIKQYINWDKVDQFKNFGGIRIEDTVLITKNGSESLTQVPKEIVDIENL